MKKCWYQQNFAKFCQILNINTIFWNIFMVIHVPTNKNGPSGHFCGFYTGGGNFTPPPGRLGGILTPGRLGLNFIESTKKYKML